MVQKDNIVKEKELFNNYDAEKNMVLTIDEIKSLIDKTEQLFDVECLIGGGIQHEWKIKQFKKSYCRN